MCMLIASCVEVSLVVCAYNQVNFLEFKKTFMRKIVSETNIEQQIFRVQQTIKDTY